MVFLVKIWQKKFTHSLFTQNFPLENFHSLLRSSKFLTLIYQKRNRFLHIHGTLSRRGIKPVQHYEKKLRPAGQRKGGSCNIDNIRGSLHHSKGNVHPCSSIRDPVFGNHHLVQAHLRAPSVCVPRLAVPYLQSSLQAALWGKDRPNFYWSSVTSFWDSTPVWRLLGSIASSLMYSWLILASGGLYLKSLESRLGTSKVPLTRHRADYMRLRLWTFVNRLLYYNNFFLEN